MSGSGEPGSLAELRGLRVLVFGAGGGGDALGATHLYLKLRGLGAEPLIGSIVWERRVVDPEPGPIPLEQVRPAKQLAPGLGLVTGESRALRRGVEVWPQLARAAKALGVEGVYLDASKGGEGLREALHAAVDLLGLDAVIGVDVGGDMLAWGCEEELWSPLADAMSLHALNSLKGRVIAWVEVLSPGGDGELPKGRVLERIAEAARHGGLVEATGLSRSEYQFLKSVEDLFVSEASRTPLRGFEGATGELVMRGGERRVTLDPVNATGYIVTAEAAARVNRIHSLVAGTRSAREAADRLNEACIYTELDLEEDLDKGVAATPLEAREKGRRRLKEKGCTPPPGCPLGGRGAGGAGEGIG